MNYEIKVTDHRVVIIEGWNN